MPTHAELLVLLGPLADIMPRVFGVVAAVALAMVAAALIGRTFRAARPNAFLAAWVLGEIALLGGWLGFASLADYGLPKVRQLYLPTDPLSAAGIRLFLSGHGVVVFLGIMIGSLVWLMLTLRGRGADVSAEEVLTSTSLQMPSKSGSFVEHPE
jgi:hypothetical protein